MGRVDTVREGQVPRHTLRADIPEQLEQTVAMCMQKEPEKRFKTGVDLAALNGPGRTSQPAHESVVSADLPVGGGPSR